MPSNILITGAGGYIGGSLIADCVSAKILTDEASIIAAVRSEDQAKALSKLGINVLHLDLTDERAVADIISSYKINIVIHTVSSIDPKLAFPLIAGLGEFGKATGEKTYFLHTSGLSAFYPKTGWPDGVTRDTDKIFEIEKQLADSFPLRKTNVEVTEYAMAQGVTSFVVVPSTVYGRGTGEWNQLSVVVPGYVRASIFCKKVFRFAENTKVAGVHISDLTALYKQIVESILHHKSIPSGVDGYYFALAHDIYWWEALNHLEAALQKRGLITDDKDGPAIWPSDEFAAEALGVPAQFVQPLWNSGENIVAEKPAQIGWKPTHDKEWFLQNIDNEINDVVELGKAKSSLISSLFDAAKG